MGSPWRNAAAGIPAGAGAGTGGSAGAGAAGASMVTNRRDWTAGAFLIEALLLLLFLSAAISVVVWMAMDANATGRDASQLGRAIYAAQAVAEDFATDPAGVQQVRQQGEFQVECTVQQESGTTGTLYRANIRVFDSSGQVLYTLETAGYTPSPEGQVG